MIKIVPIVKNDFYHGNIPTVFHEKEHARHYYEVSYDGEGVFQFSMQSEILPVFIEINNVIVIGCDQTVMFYCLDSKEVVKIISLLSLFYDFNVNDKYIYIICEVEIIILLKENFDECKSIEFIEYIDHVDINKTDVLVYFIDGSSESIHM